MKKLLLVPVLIFFVGCSSIDKAVMSRALNEMESTDKLIDAKLLQYVKDDASLDADSKDDWQKLIDSRNRIVSSLKKAVE